MRNFTLAVTKVKLMRLRLGQLGQLGDFQALSIGTCPPDGIAEADNDWPRNQCSTRKPLGIQDLIQRTTELCRRCSQGVGSKDNKFQVSAPVDPAEDQVIGGDLLNWSENYIKGP